MLPKSFCFKLMSHQNQKIKNQRLLETTVILSGIAIVPTKGQGC